MTWLREAERPPEGRAPIHRVQPRPGQCAQACPPATASAGATGTSCRRSARSSCSVSPPSGCVLPDEGVNECQTLCVAGLRSQMLHLALPADQATASSLVSCSLTSCGV